ncbi:MAG: rhomboid family intramembrane serine protease [bacterium]
MKGRAMDDINAPPLNPLPPVVWLLALPMIAMEVVVSAGAGGLVGGPAAIGWRAEAMQTLAFAPDYLRQMWALQQFPAELLWRFFSYPFVHLDMTHALFVVVILLALGKYVGAVYAWWAVMITYFVAAACGALAYTAVPLAHAALIGGYPPDYGLIGAYTFLLWVKLVGGQGNRLQAFRLIGFLLGFQVIFAIGGIAYYGVERGTTWEWVADLAGFVSGFVVAFVVSPGGWARVLAKLRGD